MRFTPVYPSVAQQSRSTDRAVTSPLKGLNSQVQPPASLRFGASDTSTQALPMSHPPVREWMRARVSTFDQAPPLNLNVHQFKAFVTTAIMELIRNEALPIGQLFPRSQAWATYFRNKFNSAPQLYLPTGSILYPDALQKTVTRYVKDLVAMGLLQTVPETKELRIVRKPTDEEYNAMRKKAGLDTQA